MDDSSTGLNYSGLSLADVRTALDDIARETQVTFGGLSGRQLNWRPDAARWSVAQCFEHLLTANRLMFLQMDDALSGGRPPTIWERLPVLPGVLGRMLIRSQAPGSARKFTAPSKAQPATSDLPADIVQRFVEQHLDAVARVRALEERDAARAIMTSPFVRVVTYSVLDGWRLVVAHDRRHVEQARRVTQSPGFPDA